MTSAFSIYRYILDARGKAIITMLEMIKNKLMKRLYKKKEWIGKYQGVLCPKIEKKLNKIGLEAALFTPDYSGGPKVSVEGPGGPYIVNMLRKTCTCRRWDLTGLPCPHAMVSILGNNENVEDYVHEYYKVETFKNVYSHYINPTNPEDHWPEVLNGGEVLPPKVVKKKRGRKPKARRKEAEELEKQKQAEAQRQAERRAEKRGEELAPKKLSKKGLVHIKCSICKKNGHNARGHYKYTDTFMPRASPSFEIQQVVSDYEVTDYEETRDNSQLEANLTNYSTITQAPSQVSLPMNVDAEFIGVQVQSSVAIQDERVYEDEFVEGVMGVQDEGDGTVFSKRGRIYKNRVMNDFVCDVLRKKSRNC